MHFIAPIRDTRLCSVYIFKHKVTWTLQNMAVWHFMIGKGISVHKIIKRCLGLK